MKFFKEYPFESGFMVGLATMFIIWKFAEKANEKSNKVIQNQPSSKMKDSSGKNGNVE